MIKTVEVEQRKCDFCGTDAYEWTACLSCGKDLCPAWSATETKPHVVRYPHAVSFSGSGDGYYCIPCDIRLSEDRSDPLHQAYVAITALRDEGKQLYESQERKNKKAETRLSQLRAERGLR